LKYVIVLFLLTVVAALIYWRIRPYINFVRRTLEVVRSAQRINTPQDINRRPQEASRVNEKLTRCAACGVWLPASRAISVNSKFAAQDYCSHACIERATAKPQQKRKSAV